MKKNILIANSPATYLFLCKKTGENLLAFFIGLRTGTVPTIL
jgi:hypothetical protein